MAHQYARHVTRALDDAEFRTRIQQTLDAWVDDQGRRLAPLGADAGRLVEAARRALTGGKRLRAAFCYYGYLAVADPPPDMDALVKACASLEVLHASALVHDDYMDASETRRGRPAAHRAFASQHREAGLRSDPERFGAAAAILLGDLMLSWADEMLRSCGLPDERVAEALAILDHTRSEVIVGQFLDVSIQARGRGTVDEAMLVLRYKSAKYSVERPLHLGATLAGADAATLEELTGFGLPVGEAFQLRDDLLGVFGDPVETGKPAGDDLVEGKRTVLIAMAEAHGSPVVAHRIDSALGRPLSPVEVAEVRGLIDQTGARAEVERLIEKLTAQALDALEASALAEPGRGALRDLAIAATRRRV
jgi:geranylgeranyl diphosphate synthase type I